MAISKGSGGARVLFRVGTDFFTEKLLIIKIIPKHFIFTVIYIFRGTSPFGRIYTQLG